MEDVQERNDKISSTRRVMIEWMVSSGGEFKVSDIKAKFPVIHPKWIELTFAQLVAEGIMTEAGSRVKHYFFNNKQLQLVNADINASFEENKIFVEEENKKKQNFYLKNKNELCGEKTSLKNDENNETQKNVVRPKRVLREITNTENNNFQNEVMNNNIQKVILKPKKPKMISANNSLENVVSISNLENIEVVDKSNKNSEMEKDVFISIPSVSNNNINNNINKPPLFSENILEKLLFELSQLFENSNGITNINKLINNMILKNENLEVNKEEVMNVLNHLINNNKIMMDDEEIIEI